ncbi:MAG: hypothetical protein AAF408_15050 [Pseudomonadota bacterium]
MDFENRLQRIGARTSEQHAQRQGSMRSVRPAGEQLRYGLFFVGAILTMLGLQGVKFANENYEAIKSDGAIGMLAGFGLGGAVFLVAGIIIMFRAISKKPATHGQHSGDLAQPAQQVSKRARRNASRTGFILGLVSCVLMFLASEAKHIDTELAGMAVTLASLVGFGLGFVALVIGFAGLFARGYALWRVPVYFLCVWFLTFVVVTGSGIQVRDLPQFIAFFQ